MSKLDFVEFGLIFFLLSFFSAQILMIIMAEAGDFFFDDDAYEWLLELILGPRILAEDDDDNVRKVVSDLATMVQII